MILSIAAGAYLLAPGAVSAAPPIVSEQAAVNRAVGVTAIERVGRRALRKQRRQCCGDARVKRYSWTKRPYWRPYQYRYWKFYYPYGGPLF